jgi:hypothetical protein
MSRELEVLREEYKRAVENPIFDDPDIEGEYQQESNVMSYTCTKCGSEQEQQNWEEK